ncbi:MAG: alpha-glucosidase C-terminal domain-containing protein [Bacteroidetes bacterium]|nr:alpha-glucosidase C-terminal domain-containing protein [Bacteroidota bacterium]
MIRPLPSSVRTVTLLLFAALAFVSCRLKDPDSMPLDRYSLSLNGTWQFRIDPDNVGEKGHWYLGSGSEGWDTLAVPGSWDQQQRLAGYDGLGWYLRRFDAEIDTGISHALIFEAVDDNAEIWLNGEKIGSHMGYGQRFYFDVTKTVKAKGNVLAVRIEDIAGPGGLIGSVELRAFEKEEELLRSEYYGIKPVESADWVRDAVVYEVYLRAFSKEGTFKALEQRLPELRDMGVTVVWLMPIHPVGKLNRKGSLGSPYSVQDFYAVNPEFGTLDDFKSLVAATHVQGMHLIMDLVANHTAWDNPLITEHPEWYRKDDEGRIIAPNPDWSDVAGLNYDVPELRAWMKEMMLYWVRDIGIDGFRCDVAELVPHDFWVDAIAALREIKPVMMLAEGADPKLHIDAFDLTYAWSTYDMLRPIIFGKVPMTEISATLLREKFRYPRGAMHLRFTTNHDKNKYDAPPLLWLGPGAARACAVLMHMLPGVPLIYNGQETGSDKRLSLFEKETIDWSVDSLAFRVLYTDLNSIRAAQQSARRGDMHILSVGDSTAVFAFSRTIDEAMPVFTAVNLTALETAFTCATPDDLEGEVLLASARVQQVGDSLRITLPPYGYLIMK